MKTKERHRKNKISFSPKSNPERTKKPENTEQPKQNLRLRKKTSERITQFLCEIQNSLQRLRCLHP